MKINKSKSLWILAAIMVCGAMSLTSCSDSNDKERDSDADKAADEAAAISIPDDNTADKMNVRITGLTYVFNANYSGEGAALVRRAINRTQNIQDINLKNIIIHSSCVENLTQDELVAISALIINGGALMMVEPTPKEELNLIDKIVATADDCINGTITSPLYANLDYTNLEWIYGWATNGTKGLIDDYNTDPDDQSLEIIGWRGFQVYKSLNVHENETYTKNLNIVSVNEDNTMEYEPVTIEETVKMNDNLFGLQADEGAEWMNAVDDESASRAARRAAVKAIASRAGEAEQYIDNIATAQEYHLQLGGIVTFKDGDKTISRYHKVLLNRKVWAAYSFGKATDYYCINQTVKLYNQDLECGPTAEDKWWKADKWDKWNAATKKHPRARACVYGPYLRQFILDIYMKDSKPRIEKSAPVNSTSGSETVTDGISYSLGANVGFSAGKPTATVGGNITWSSSVARTNPDLAVTATTNSTDGRLNWKYDINNSMKTTNRTTVHHNTAKDVATKELELQQAWVWSMKSNESTVDIVTDWSMVDQWLTYEKTFVLETSEFFIDEILGNTDLKSQKVKQENNFTFDRIQRVNCPPRVKENWSMTIEGSGLTGEQKTKIENFLLSHLSQYYAKSFVLYSAKHGHQKSIVNGKVDLDTQDELGRLVANLKKASENNKNVAELLRLAGADAGLPANGSYNIVWRNTDINTAGYKYDKEELTIRMSETK